MTVIKRVLVLIGVSVLVACGGGGGGSSSSARPPSSPPPPPPPPPPPTGPSVPEIHAASKLGAQATFGLPYADIESIAEMGHEAWIDEQMALPATLHRPVVDELFVMLNNGELPEVENEVEHLIRFRRYAWWNRTMTAPDVLRQRVAFALSEIFVVSDNVDILIISPYALSTYYDWLLANSFGNFRDLIEAVSLHPAMGVYLSHINNRKADPANNTFPDENFARELMQLFTIGLFELNADGTEVRDADGFRIPTYDNDDIREMAKIFTGLSYPGDGAYFGREYPPYFQGRMIMFEEHHEPEEKVLLGGYVVPAGQPGLQDISDALDLLFNHPNVGPFIGRQLIQRLVKSNPSPEYVARVTAAFDGDATGVRGDMAAVIKAVLLDPEAIAAGDVASAGRLREPLMRYIAMVRQLNPSATDGKFYNNGFLQQFLLRQHPLSSPSVFNFFLPSYVPIGLLGDAGLMSPEFQITDSPTIVSMTNVVDWAVNGGFVMDIDEPFGDVSIDLTEYRDLAADGTDALLDRLDAVFTHGTMTDGTRAAIAGVVNDIDAANFDFRARTAVYLTLISPDYAGSY